MKNGAKNATAQRMKMMSAFFILFLFVLLDNLECFALLDNPELFFLFAMQR